MLNEDGGVVCCVYCGRDSYSIIMVVSVGKLHIHSLSSDFIFITSKDNIIINNKNDKTENTVYTIPTSSILIYIEHDMELYNQSISELKKLISEDVLAGYDSALLLSADFVGYKGLTINDLVYSAKTNKSMTNREVKMSVKCDYVTIIDCSAFHILTNFRIGPVMCFCVVPILAIVSDVISRNKCIIEDIIQCAMKQKSYKMPDIDPIELGICIICAIVSISAVNEICSAMFAASIWQAATMSIAPALKILTAKDIPQKVCIIACLGNFFGEKEMPCIMPNSIIEFNASYLKIYANIITRLRENEVYNKKINLENVNMDNIQMTYTKHTQDQGLNDCCWVSIFLADVISFHYDHLILGNMRVAGKQIALLVLNKILTINSKDNYINIINTNKLTLESFIDKYIMQNTHNKNYFNSSSASIYRKAYEEYKKEFDDNIKTVNQDAIEYYRNT